MEINNSVIELLKDKKNEEILLKVADLLFKKTTVTDKEIEKETGLKNQEIKKSSNYNIFLNKLKEIK